jgi:hypothetical protein
LDCTRWAALWTHLPSVRDCNHTSTSTTKSRLRLRWERLSEWITLENDVTRYANNIVTQADRDALVVNSYFLLGLWHAVSDERVRTEADIKHCIVMYV